MMKQLAGKVVLITDLEPEIGAEVADRCVHAGASVLVTGFRAAKILSERFQDQERIAFTGVDEVTTNGISELISQVLTEHGGLDVIFTNNDVHPDLDAVEMSLKQATAFSFTLHELHPLLRDGAAVVVCASFSPEHRQKSKLTADATTAFLQYSAQYWALVLEARRIRVNVVSLYKPSRTFDSEPFDLSVDRQQSKLRTRPNTVNEVASAVVDLIDADCSVSGAEINIVSGQTQINELPTSAESMILGNAAQVVDNVMFLASDVSRPLTGIELFPEGEIRKLRTS